MKPLEEIRKYYKLNKTKDKITIQYTDEEVEIVRKETDYYDFTEPINDYNLKKVFLDKDNKTR